MVKADEIPVAKTPPGGWRGDMPPPVLAGCTEPLHPDAPDLRGLWQAVRVERDGQVLTDHRLNDHVERVEQCGNRVVVTSEGVIHDMRADGTSRTASTTSPARTSLSPSAWPPPSTKDAWTFTPSG